MNTQFTNCPPDEALCSLFDGEAGSHTGRLEQHVACCPRCESRLEAFVHVRRELSLLRESAGDPGIAEAVLLRLPRRPEPPGRWRPSWLGGHGLPQFGTRVLGGVVALAAGSVLGFSVVVGGAAADRTGMSVFSAEPTRQLCVGLPSCGR